MNIYTQLYSKYMSSIDGFKTFHNEVINMPRDHFAGTGLNKVRTLAKYLLLTEGKLSKEGVSYKEIMLVIKLNLCNILPMDKDEELEKRYFSFEDLDMHYDAQGRMFRHLMGLSAFFGFITSLSKNKKIVNYEKCLEYSLSSEQVLMPIARNNLLSLNVKDNDFLKSLTGADITNLTNYRPTYSILKYLKQIERPATQFEISILLGRVGELQEESEILERALEIGKQFPKSQRMQLTQFFDNMNWIDKSGKQYVYANSQAPYFKFKSYLLLMEAFNLISINKDDTCELTEYANNILADDISYLISDLQNLVNKIGTEEDDNAKLNDLILYQRNPELMELAKSDKNFFIKMNKRSLENPIYDKGKRVRNRLISELAKIEVDYMCQYAMRHIFKMPNGKYYCESHHILEFSRESGPDITNNLLILGPEAHKLLHHANNDEIENAYLQLIKNGALNLNRFKEMINIYNCLTEKHIDILSNKKIITKLESIELKSMLAA